MGIYRTDDKGKGSDVITQLLMGIPLTILYEVGILLSKVVYKKRKSSVGIPANAEKARMPS